MLTIFNMHGRFSCDKKNLIFHNSKNNKIKHPL